MEQNTNMQSITIDELVASSRQLTKIHVIGFEGMSFESSQVDRISREGP